MICIWSSWCHCHTIISCFSKIQNGLPIWCRLTQVVLEKRLLNRCSSSSSSSFPYLSFPLGPLTPFSQIDIIGAMEGERDNYQVCSVQYCVQQLCTVQCTHVLTDLTVLWNGFCLTGPISLRLDSFLWLFCVIGQAIIFLPCGFYFLLLSVFFPRLISAVRDWVSTILPHMVWP